MAFFWTLQLQKYVIFSLFFLSAYYFFNTEVMKPMKSVYTIYFLVSVIFAFGQLRICVLHIKFVLAVCIRFFENYFQFIVVSLYCEFVRLHSVRWNVLVFLFFSFLEVPGPFNFDFDCVLKISKTFNYFFRSHNDGNRFYLGIFFK